MNPVAASEVGFGPGTPRTLYRADVRGPGSDPFVTGTAGRARNDLRRQIARLERALAGVQADSFLTERAASPSFVPRRGPGRARRLTLGELEDVRDDLAHAIAEAEARTRSVQDNRDLLARMRADPGAFRGYSLTGRELGLAACCSYDVVPRFGLFGRLGGWWRVRVSSGCPLGIEARWPRDATPAAGGGDGLVPRSAAMAGG